MPKKSKGALLSEEDGPSEGAHQTDSKKKGRRKGRRRSDVSDSEDEAHDGNARQDSAKVVDNKRQEQLKCFFCGKRGHTRAECPEAQACEFPFVDACCCLHGCFGRANYYGPAFPFLEARGLQDSCERIVAVFADAACMAQSSDRYRCWEEILAPDRIVGAFGCWPSHAQELEAVVEGKLEQWIEACGPKVVALVGGLDYSPPAGGGGQGYGSEEEEEAREAQRRVLGRILSLSRHLALPVVLSCLGGAEKDLSALLSASALPPESSRLLLADFSGDPDFLVLKLLPQWPQMSVGFDGRLTFSKAEHLRGLLFDVPLERLLLQSSAPSHLPATLSPSSRHDEGFSHPAVVPVVAAKVAELKEATLEEVMEQARSNAKAMFGI